MGSAAEDMLGSRSWVALFVLSLGRGRGSLAKVRYPIYAYAASRRIIYRVKDIALSLAGEAYALGDNVLEDTKQQYD